MKIVKFIIEENGNEYSVTMNRDVVESLDTDELLNQLKIVVNDRKKLVNKTNWKCNNMLIGKEL